MNWREPRGASPFIPLRHIKRLKEYIWDGSSGGLSGYTSTLRVTNFCSYQFIGRSAKTSKPDKIRNTRGKGWRFFSETF